MRIGFIGLGSMGQLMAKNRLKAGHQLKVWNRSQAHCSVWRHWQKPLHAVPGWNNKKGCVTFASAACFT